ncbi:MAG: hypothetical protein EBR82_79175, partial [Caulobacteraceae bacterium]|nr:hypothetical protein [Caulobacteraceae bacterium]
VAGIAGSAAPAVARTAQALGTIAKAEGGKAAVQQGARLLAPAAAIGAGVDTGIRAVTGQEITPGSVATGALLNTLFAGYGANTRVANYTRDEARGLFQRVMEGNGSLKDTDDLLSILNQMKQQSPEGMPMQDFGRAQRTTVDVLGKRAVDRTTLEQPTFRTPPADEAAMLTGRRGPDPVVQRTPELPQAGVRGNVRGTQADAGELQRRGVSDEMQRTLLEEADLTPIAPNPRSEGQIVSQGRVVGPRQQLPTTERLALPETGVEPLPMPKSAEEAAAIIERRYQTEAATRRSPAGQEGLRQDLAAGRNSIPLPFGKKGEAGMVTSDVIAKPAEVYKTFLTSTGDLPKSLFDIVEARGGHTNAMLKQVQFTTRDVRGEINKALAGVAPKERGAAQSKLMEGVNAVIRGQAEPSTLPENVASSVIQMRRQLDNLSDGLISSGVFSEE